VTPGDGAGRVPGANTLVAVSLGLAVLCAALAGLLAFDVVGEGVERPPGSGNGSAPPDAPGSGYAGIVGAQGAEVREEYDVRSFDERLAAASSDESRAAAIAAETRRIESRLAELEARGDALRGLEDDDPAYRARVTSFVARSVALEGRLDRVRAAAEPLPPAVRDRFGLTAAAFDSLRERTDALTSPEMVDLARRIAGDDVGDDFDGDDADDRDDSDDADDDDDQDDRDSDDDDSDDQDDSDDADDSDDD